jgi:formate hydrogenlyase subunit 5
MTTPIAVIEVPVEELALAVAGRVDGGARFGGIFASAAEARMRLRSILVKSRRIEVIDALLSPGAVEYPALTPLVPAAAWYEREMADLFGLVPSGHPRPDPLVLPLSNGAPRPRPGSGKPMGKVELDLDPLPSHLTGQGVFTIPYGPVRSGVFESIEYLVETPGENIPHVRSRVYHKHRGVDRSFEGRTAEDGAVIAERVEGVASVAHAIAFCQAIEKISETQIPLEAALLRVLHAELERIANHLDSTIRHTEAAGQAVAYSRFTAHKERILRLRARLCGHRFGRGVVVPGGVSARPLLSLGEILRQIDHLEKQIRADIRLLLDTPSFVDRLRATGILATDLARRHGALGPVGRASGQLDDARLERPYAGYSRLGLEQPRPRDKGDALARQHVRVEEIWASFHLIRQVIDELEVQGMPPSWKARVHRASGEAISWSEAPQGELLYILEVFEGRLVRVKPRSASFHNLALFPYAFPKDIFTDFAFIEASFGLSIAGVSG